MTSTFPPISAPTACVWVNGDAAEAATYSPSPSISGFLRFSPDRFGSLEQAEQALRHAHSAIGEGTFHDFTFDPGVSITLLYQDQAGIDGAWSVLSQVADAERCGWCVDTYGVSWQVLPHNIGELMADTDARAKLLSMGKIDLNQL